MIELDSIYHCGLFFESFDSRLGSSHLPLLYGITYEVFYIYWVGLKSFERTAIVSGPAELLSNSAESRVNHVNPSLVVAMAALRMAHKVRAGRGIIELCG